jgi:hypothetical protein
MDLVKLYAHGDVDSCEIDELADEIAHESGCDHEKIVELVKRRPLYEVECEFDLATGRCVRAVVDGVTLVPR